MSDYRFSAMKAIKDAVPRPRTPEQGEAAIEALLLVAATSYLASTRTPFTTEAAGEMAADALEAFERYTTRNQAN